MAKRKTPVQHKVKSHRRKNDILVESYVRGRGTKTIRSKKVGMKVGMKDRVVVIPGDVYGVDLFNIFDAVGGEHIGSAEPKYEDDMIKLIKDMRRVEGKLDFYDIGAGGDEYQVIGVPKGVRVDIKGDNVEKVSVGKIMDENDISMWDVAPRSEWPVR